MIISSVGLDWSSQLGRVVWITGLSGAGKTTLASCVAEALRRNGNPTVMFDGDELQEVFSSSTYTVGQHERQSRLALAFQYSRLCSMVARQGYTVVIATISMFSEVYAWNRNNLPGYLEIYLRVPRAELMRRDPKGIYREFAEGKLKNVAGFDLPVDEPQNAHCVIDFDPDLSVWAVAGRVLKELEG